MLAFNLFRSGDIPTILQRYPMRLIGLLKVHRVGWGQQDKGRQERQNRNHLIAPHNHIGAESRPYARQTSVEFSHSQSFLKYQR